MFRAVATMAMMLVLTSVPLAADNVLLPKAACGPFGACAEKGATFSGARAAAQATSESAKEGARRPLGSANAHGLDVMMERARQDLAQRLGVDAATIKLDGMRAHRWPDSTLGCPRAGESIRPGPVDGFMLSLRHAGRSYTYHTDREHVRPCPAIESR